MLCAESWPGEDPDLLGVLGQVRQDREQQLRADPLALQVGRDGEPAERRPLVLQAHPDRPDEAVPGPGAERDDAVGREVLAQLLEGLRQRRDVRVAVDLRLAHERRPPQGEQLAGLVVGDGLDRDVGCTHDLIVSALRENPTTLGPRVPRIGRPRSPRTAQPPSTGCSRSRARTGPASCTRSPGCWPSTAATSPSRSSSATRCRGCSSCASRSSRPPRAASSRTRSPSSRPGSR